MLPLQELVSAVLATQHPQNTQAAAPRPQLPALIDQQQRFRITGSGPISSRQIVPVTAGARQLLASAPAAADAVRSVLLLVEHAAGGANASASLPMNGVALALDSAGHSANVFAAHADDDQEFVRQFNRSDTTGQKGMAADLAKRAFAEVPDTRAMVTNGWVNLDPGISAALLATRGVSSGSSASVTADDLGMAVRVLRHEAEHLVDTSIPNLTGGGADGLREALAEANSTSMEQLRDARHTLGLDRVVSDASLAQSLDTHPYPGYEATLEHALRVSGIDPASSAAAQLVARPSADVAEVLVDRISRAEGTSTARARSDISIAFGPDNA